MDIKVDISLGELVDKITILEIKTNKINSSIKLENINKELTSLKKTLAELNLINNEFKLIYRDLKKVNEELWDIEDKIRILEKNKKFDDEFIEIARSVYISNDKRFELKYKLNKLFDSKFVEEKSYEDY